MATGERKLDARQQEIRKDRLCSRDATLANHLGGCDVDKSRKLFRLLSFGKSM